MIKCIATDMDGTLLNASQEVSEENKLAIEAARKQGIDFLVATGRSYHDLRYVLDKVGIRCPAICLNGAEIRDAEGNVEFGIGLEAVIAEKVAYVLDNADMYYELYTSNGTYTTNYEKGIQAVMDIYRTANPSIEVSKLRQRVEKRFKKRLIKIVDDFDDVFGSEDITTYKFFGFSKDQSLLVEVSKRLEQINGITVTTSGRQNIEITHKNAKKGNALKRYTEKRGISLEETMALGDNYNDLSMLEMVGHSVAMGNAEKEIKDTCRYVTGLNTEDGVAEAIYKALEEMAIS
ncbi:Cof-type HAD-IIB family hydrolase [Siminovitchia fortis]|uniref:HAD family phosphatase n=1 Tax=Siminovitchia fortis TaxID=254758 RepID=A0A443IWT2_9BACI|nr:Cof-type HAD-IIB family hydrolase [Siminovitchia fortis]RWR12519.1 HAD family phosphatase [Siminovitchia fortis]WHY81639.1 Cof-type HAD-IIB family hydrolase [Siminovitchia fortis]